MTADKPGILRLMQMDADKQAKTNGVVHDVIDTPGALSVPGAAGETALSLPPDMLLSEWAATGEVLNQVHKAWKWWFGDWLNYGEDHWPEEYAQYMDITDLPYQSIKNIMSVARNIPPHMRHKTLPWSSHADVVPLTFKDKGAAMKVIEQADEEQWPRHYLRAVVKAGGVDALPGVQVIDEKEPCDCYCCKSDYCKECGHPWGS